MKLMHYPVQGFTPSKGPKEAPKTVSRNVFYAMKSLRENLPKKSEKKS